MLIDFDPTTIADEKARQVVTEMMNLVEALHATVVKLQDENQKLRDENNQLKGEQGKPKILPNTRGKSRHSSESERANGVSQQSRSREPKPQSEEEIPIDEVKVLTVDPAILPEDAQFKGYEEVIVQDVEFRTVNTKFRKEKYYSPHEKRSYLAPMPPGYHGQFGPGVRAWVLALYHATVTSEPKILELLRTIGLRISAGQLSNLLIKDQELFHAEYQAVVRAGLASSPWQHLDSTGTRVDGQNSNCHILCNPLYTAYCTTRAKDRLALLRVLQGGTDPAFRLNNEAIALATRLGVGKKWCNRLTGLLPQKQDMTEEQVDALLDLHLSGIGPLLRKNVKDALAIIFYQNQSIWPVVQLLICDDAPQFNALTAQLALCWIHEFRHYKKLTPLLPFHQKQLNLFSESFWKLYHQLLDYQHHPEPLQAEAIQKEFDRIFTQTTGYAQLDARLSLTLAKRESLLMALCHPEILLHNNPAELGARQRVRKRDVSLQARTQEGISTWDTFQTLGATAKKLAVNFYQYLYDRVAQINRLPSLASLITERAREQAFDTSWQGNGQPASVSMAL